MEPLDYCPGCQEDRPLDDFVTLPGETIPSSGALLCRLCRLRKKGPTDPLPALPPKYRKLLKDLLTSPSIAEAARSNDLSETYVRSLISRKIPGKTGEMVASAWQLLLEAEGLDLHTIARVSKLLLFAMRAQWNPGTESWDFFPDNPVRLGMVKHLTRQHRVDPQPLRGFQGSNAAVVVINYDSDKKDSEKEVSGFHIEVPREAAEKVA
jgi:hypothetical protein